MQILQIVGKEAICSSNVGKEGKLVRLLDLGLDCRLRVGQKYVYYVYPFHPAKRQGYQAGVMSFSLSF